MAAIQQRMRELIDKDYDVIKKMTPRAEVIELFKSRGEDYKLRLIDDMPDEKAMGLYFHEEYVDYVPRPARAEHSLPQGVPADQDFRRLLARRLEERAVATHLRHRLGRQEATGGPTSSASKRPRSATIAASASSSTCSTCRKKRRAWCSGTRMAGASTRCSSSTCARSSATMAMSKCVPRRWSTASLWERSGHWSNYAENMFTTSSESRDYAVKPMNCPCHVQIFNQGLKSYRDLPLRLAEFGACHRNEPSGALHGIMRVRGFTQDDAHIFCTEEQVKKEAADFIKLTLQVYRDFGFTDIAMKLSTRPAKRVGSDELWDRAEGALADALNESGLAWEYQPGEGAFYGPKIEFTLKDCLGRNWQCGTLQYDPNLPERLDASYIAEDNNRKRPVMLHRAILGSFERFIGMLIEHYAGAFPAWLAPTQAVVMNITDKQADFAAEVVRILGESGFRAKSDLRNEKIGF